MNYFSTKSYRDEVASIVGVEAAVLFHSLFLWCDFNTQNKQNFRDGRYWTYQTAEQISEYFPYWSPSKIVRMIDSLRDSGLIYVCLYNKAKHDRTRWFSINYEVLNGILNPSVKNENSIFQIRKLDTPNTETPSSEYGNSYKEQIDNTNSKEQINTIYAEFVSEINSAFGKMYKGDKKSRSQFNARINDGWTLADMVKAVRNARLDDYHKSNSYKYCTPEFFTRPDKIDKFLNMNSVGDVEAENLGGGLFKDSVTNKFFRILEKDGKMYECQRTGEYKYDDNMNKIPYTK